MGILRTHGATVAALCLAVISVAFLALSVGAEAADVIANGGFETGDFGGWILGPNPGTNGCDTPWVVGFDANAPQCQQTLDPMFGTFAAYSSWDGPGPLVRTLSQTFVVGNGGLTVGNLSWYETHSWNLCCAGATLPRHMSVSLYDDQNVLIATVSTVSIFPPTVGGPAFDPTIVSWSAFNANIQALLATQAGRSVTLSFTQDVPEVLTGPAGIGVDNISLDLQYLCNVTVGNDACTVSATTPTDIVVDAAAGIDTLQLGGAANFSFDASKIGDSQSFKNFEAFEKVGTSNITLSGTAGAAASWAILSGTLTASGGNAIFDTSPVAISPGATLALTSSETIGALSGAGSLALGANTLTVGGNNSSTSWDGASSGSGGLTKMGSGVFTVGSDLGYSGPTVVNEGTMIVNGTVTGSVFVGAGATLGGATTINGNLNNQGTLAPGNSPGIVMVLGDYVGGGALAMEVAFDNASLPTNGSTHDFLSIAGTVTGTTLLNIIPYPPSGSAAETTGSGIELVRVGGTVVGNQFALAGPVFQGGFQYTLQFVPTAGPDSFFLQSHAREEIWGHVALLAAGQTMTHACFHGDERGRDSPDGASRRRVWAKYTGGNQDTGADTGLDLKQDFSCAAGGIDFNGNDNVRLGLSGGFGNSAVDVVTPAGLAHLNGDQDVIEAYASYLRDNVFMNLSAGYGTTDWSFDGSGLPLLSATADGVIASVHVGAHWLMGRLRVGLIGELDYDGATCGNSCLIVGVSEDAQVWQAGASLRLDGQFSNGKILPYIAISFSDGLGDGNSVSLGHAAVDADTASRLLGAQAGLTAYVDERVALFADIRLSEGFDSAVSGYNGQGGVKLYW